jgi:hypothetical protein
MDDLYVQIFLFLVLQSCRFWQVLRLLNEHCGKEYAVHLCDEW